MRNVRPVLAILLAGAAASFYSLSTMLQALEARNAPLASALRASLLIRLFQKRTWLAGSAVGGLGWGLQAVALTFASIALVQPALGLGLLVLLLFGHRLLGERVGRREVGGALTVVAGVAVLCWAAPSGIDHFTHGGRISIAIIGGLVVAAPRVLRFARLAGGLPTSVVSGLGWAWVGVATALLDRALANEHWVDAVLWGGGAGLVSWSSLVIGMSALQVWPATRSWPITFALEIAVPPAFAPILTRGGVGPAHGVPFGLALLATCAGASVLGSSRSVAQAVAASSG
jgi:drug/metabolite transporter (DMT)-like permease